MRGRSPGPPSGLYRYTGVTTNGSAANAAGQIGSAAKWPRSLVGTSPHTPAILGTPASALPKRGASPRRDCAKGSAICSFFFRFVAVQILIRRPMQDDRVTGGCQIDA